FIFRTMNGITIEFFRIPEGITPTDSAPVTTSIWKVWISKKIPSNGEILRGHILFFAKKQFDGDLHPDETYLPKFGSMVSGTPAVSFERDTTWQLEVPVELVLGTRGALASEDNIGSVIEEGARCHKIIIESFPQERQKDLVAQIDALPRKSAGDYRKFSESLFDQAHEYWASEQKSYLIWEGVWSTSIWVLEKSVIAGDIAFQVLVGYATKNLGPWTAYFTSTIATTLKNEGVNFYLFYAAEQREMDVCARLYVEREWKTFLEGVVTGAVDATILKDFRIEKVVTDPKRCLRTVAWLWLWKFGRNLYKDPDAGYYVAMKRATEELGRWPLSWLSSITSMRTARRISGSCLKRPVIRDILEALREDLIQKQQSPRNHPPEAPTRTQGTPSFAAGMPARQKSRHSARQPGILPEIPMIPICFAGLGRQPKRSRVISMRCTPLMSGIPINRTRCGSSSTISGRESMQRSTEQHASGLQISSIPSSNPGIRHTLLTISQLQE
ncbi:MAG TPA: hypothetical protein PLY13_03985, partial [Methanoregulaceae archaeon]|nr:hypothetical protein [Methanoregulaceae archaeon]